MTLTQEAAEILERLELYGVRLGLETTRSLMGSLGDPQEELPTVLVAGSNGKGSTAALLASMASAAGYRTGLYTSPHLEDVEERVRIDGTAVNGELLSRDLAKVVGTAERDLGHPPTYFEALTAACLCRFVIEKVDLAVLEVGVGGRLDATNITNPSLSLITEVGFDHRAYLGDTLDAIAREKAGIMREGRPTLAWVTRDEVRTALEAVAQQKGARLHFGPEHVRIGAIEAEACTQTVELKCGSWGGPIKTNLLGRHQVRNLALAVFAAHTLQGAGWPNLDFRAAARGAASCKWPGRLERVELPGDRVVVLDSAHNPDGAQVLGEYLAESRPGYSLLFGALADKEVDRVLPLLAADAKQVFLTTPSSGRAADPADLRRLIPDRQVTVEPDPRAALDAALASLAEEWLVVCGSIYLVGEVREALRERFMVPPAAVGRLYGMG